MDDTEFYLLFENLKRRLKSERDAFKWELAQTQTFRDSARATFDELQAIRRERDAIVAERDKLTNDLAALLADRADVMQLRGRIDELTRERDDALERPLNAVLMLDGMRAQLRDLEERLTAAQLERDEQRKIAENSSAIAQELVRERDRAIDHEHRALNRIDILVRERDGIRDERDALRAKMNEIERSKNAASFARILNEEMQAALDADDKREQADPKVDLDKVAAHRRELGKRDRERWERDKAAAIAKAGESVDTIAIAAEAMVRDADAGLKRSLCASCGGVVLPGGECMACNVQPTPFEVKAAIDASVQRDKTRDRSQHLGIEFMGETWGQENHCQMPTPNGRCGEVGAGLVNGFAYCRRHFMAIIDKHSGQP